MQLREWRKTNGLSRDEVAVRVSINRHTYRAIESGGRKATPTQAARIEQATGGSVTAAELLAHLVPPGYELVKLKPATTVA